MSLARTIRISTTAVGVISLLLFPCMGKCAAPTLTRLFPAGGQRGTTVNVTCSGEFDWPVSVWAPGIDVLVGEESGALSINIPPDLATDRVWMRLYDEEGASQIVPFLIGNLPEVSEAEPNDAPDEAQALAGSRMTVNGVLQESGDVDGFAVTVSAGSTLVADVDAHDKFGSPMDAVLQIVSSDGFVLAENHDDFKLDPRIAFEVPADGTYIVRVFAFPAEPDSSIAFSGSEDYVYRLTITDGPFISHTVPSVATPDAPGDVEVFGWNIPAGTRLPVVPLDPGMQTACGEISRPLGSSHPGSRVGWVHRSDFAGSARVRLMDLEALPGIAVTSQESPMALHPPAAVTGQIQSSGQVDYFDLPLPAQFPLIVTAESRSLELPLQLRIELTDPTGALIEEFGVVKEFDAVVTHLTEQEGVYRLTVSELFRQHGERCIYRLTAMTPVADLELEAGKDAIVVKPGEPTDLTLILTRMDSVNEEIGDVTIEALDLPPGVTAEPILDAKVSGAHSLEMVFNTNGEPYSGPIRIVARATEPRAMERIAFTPSRYDACLSVIWLTAVGADEPAEGDSPTE